MARRDESSTPRRPTLTLVRGKAHEAPTSADESPSRKACDETPSPIPATDDDAGPRAEDNYWRIRLQRNPMSTNPRTVDLVAAISLDGHVSVSWLSEASYLRLRPLRLRRDDSDGSVHGKATETPAGRRGDLAELRRVWMALFDARFGTS